ncbi:hypothetical protein AB4Z45_01875 [Paenibacillus sp. MCAF9]|uniref:hypothetical protein n=1 Tax=unclassified Paenibacillus TaxID=185978 RepID=UPI003F9E2A14
MKKYVLIATVAIACLTAFSFAPAGGREYTPVEQTPDMITGYVAMTKGENNHYTLSIDQIDWYEGDAATKIFLEREKDSGLDAPPDGYYIENDDETLRDLPIADNAEVLMQIYNRTGNINDADIVWNEPISVKKFIELINTEDDFDMKSFPYHMTIKNGEIVRIVQQFVP